MTIKVQNLSDLQDRRIMMDKKLPPYGYAFVSLQKWTRCFQKIC